ncbi:MAG TPA: YihY/virulence factor BrkB family protein [Chitinophagaceae bacterium]|jgi:membrane protein|nr:YihY/virulence factor BrkB family protein [Chitinophagaceae bacterium]
MTKLERIILSSSPVRKTIRTSKKIIIPGFEKVPLYDVVVVFIRQIRRVGLTERASYIAFNFLMAIPAAIIFLCTLIPYFPFSKSITPQLLVLALANDFIRDAGTFLAVEKFLNDFINTPREGLLSLGFFLAVLYSSNAMMGIMRTFNKSLVKSNKRNFFESRWMAIKLTTLVIILVIISMVLSIVQGQMFDRLLIWMDIRNSAVISLIDSLRYVTIIALIFYAIAFIYKYAPAVQKRWKLSSPGTVLATILTIITTFLFSFWVARFNNFNKIYGSIGTILIIMLLTYINSLILLIGFELNVSIYANKQLAEEKQKQREKDAVGNR